MPQPALMPRFAPAGHIGRLQQQCPVLIASFPHQVSRKGDVSSIAKFASCTWTADSDYPACTPSNTGSNAKGMALAENGSALLWADTGYAPNYKRTGGSIMRLALKN